MLFCWGEMKSLLTRLGVDMIATYITERFPHPIAAHSLMGLDVDPTVLGQDYRESMEQMFAKVMPKEALAN